jgi:hypothetical protein
LPTKVPLRKPLFERLTSTHWEDAEGSACQVNVTLAEFAVQDELLAERMRGAADAFEAGTRLAMATRTRTATDRGRHRARGLKALSWWA